MKKCGLTEKNMSNGRFRNKECIIFISFCKIKDYPSAKKLATLAGISRSTLYRHHKNVQCIPTDYEKYLLHNYHKVIRKLVHKKCITVRNVLFRTLIFISNNKEIMRMLFEDERKEIIKKMIDYLKPKISAEWGTKGNVDKMYDIYKNEILGCIELWSKQDFSEENLQTTLNDILYLTETASQKLSHIE